MGDKPKWEVKPFDFSKVKKNKNSNVKREPVRETGTINETSVIDEPVQSDPVLGMGDQKQAEYESTENFFDQKPPRNINDLYQNPQDATKTQTYDYKKLNKYPITKKIYKERVNNPENREHTFPIAQPEETETGSIVSKDIDPELQAQEIVQKTAILHKIHTGEITLPGFVKQLPEADQLAYVGATYNNNPLFSAIVTLADPLIHLSNIATTGINKVTGSDFKTFTPPNMSSEDEDDKLITGGVELLTSLIPLGASIKGANYLFKGLKNPFVRNMLSSGVGFLINSQPALVDNLTQNNMSLKDYAIQSAKDFVTGVTFGALPKGTPLKYEIPYQSIVPTMVPVIGDLIEGKPVDEKEIMNGVISNVILSFVMSGNLPKETKVKELTGKVKNELSKYAEEQQTPELVNNVIAGLLPPARVENVRTITNIKPGEINPEIKTPSRIGKLFGDTVEISETRTKPALEEVKFPTDRNRIIVDEKGNARIDAEREAEPLIIGKGYGKEKDGIRFDKTGDIMPERMTEEQLKSSQENINSSSKSGLSKSDFEAVKDLAERISKGETNFTIEDLKTQRKFLKETSSVKDPGEIKLTDNAKSELEAGREQNKGLKVSDQGNVNDARREELNSVNQRINEMIEKSKTSLGKEERLNISESIETLQEQRKALENDIKRSRVNETEIIPERSDISKLPENELKNEMTGREDQPENVNEALKNNINIISKNEYDKSIQNIKDRGKNIYSNPLDVTVLKDFAVVGLYHLDNGLRTFKDWAIKMVRELGDKVKPHLKNLWKEINDPKSVRKFRERNPEAEFHTSGIGLKNNNETYEQYATRIAKEFRKVPTREEYAAEKNKALFPDVPNEAAEIKKEEATGIKNESNERISRETKPVSQSNQPTKINKVDPGKKKNSSKNEVYMNKVQSKINELKDKYEKEFKGQKLYDKAETETRRFILNDPEFKNFNYAQKRAVIKAVKQTFKDDYRKKSGYYNEDGFEYIERGFRDKIFNKGFKQSLNVVKEMGEAGKEFAEIMKKMADDERSWMGKAHGVIIDIEALSKQEKYNLEKIWEAKMNETVPPNYLNENVKNADVIIDNYFKDIASELNSRAFTTTNKVTGDVYPFTPKKDYRPRMFNEKIDELDIVYDARGVPKRNIEREKILNHLVETKQANDLAQASSLLNNEIAKNRIFKAGNVEYSRNEKIRLPDDYYISDPVSSLIKYAKRVSTRIAFVDAWGMNGSVAKRLIDDMRKNHKNFKFAEELYKIETHQISKDEREAFKNVNSIKSLQALTKFTPFTTLRNSLQGFLGTSTRANLKSGLMGIAKSLSPVMRRYAKESGALADDLEGYIKDSFAGSNSSKIAGLPVGRMASAYLDLIQFSRTDRANRIISAVGGFSFMKDMLNRIKNNSPLKKRALREFERLDLNAEEIIKRGEFTKEERNKIMRRFAYDTQFSTRPQDLPLFWSSPFGKLVTQWKPFGYKMTQMLRDSVVYETKKGNLFPLLTYLTAYGVAGETVNYIIDNVRGITSFDPKKDEWEEPNERTLINKISKGDVSGSIKRLIEDMSGLGALSLFVDIGRTLGYGKGSSYQKIGNVSSVISGPALSEFYDSFGELVIPPAAYIFQYEDDFQKSVKNTLKGLTHVTLRNLPGAGTLRTLGLSKMAMEYIFPGKKTNKDVFKKSLSEEERKIFKEYDELQKSRDRMKKKALETKDPEDVKIHKQFKDQFDRMDKSPIIQKYKQFKKDKLKERKELEEILDDNEEGEGD